MVIKLFYHGHKCAEIFVDYLMLSDGVWIGVKNGETVCRFDSSQYNVVKINYSYEVNKVV